MTTTTTRHRILRAIERDETAVLTPFKLPLVKFVAELRKVALEAIQSGYTGNIGKLLETKLLELLNAATELAYLKGGRRSELADSRVIDESREEYAPVRFSLQDSGTDKAQKIIDYLKKVTGSSGAKKGTFEGLNQGVISGF